MTSTIGKSMLGARGFTLVESLVALVVLSIGLLGIASLQLSSLRWNHGASLRSQATLLAYDILDRMRANQVVARTTTDYVVAMSATKTGTTVADKDVAQWKTTLLQTLPSGDGSIERIVVGTETNFRITVRWDDSHGNFSSTDPTTTVDFQMSTQL
jgi:type IV pilus assembly protein PilV